MLDMQDSLLKFDGYSERGFGKLSVNRLDERFFVYYDLKRCSL